MWNTFKAANACLYSVSKSANADQRHYLETYNMKNVPYEDIGD